MCGLLMRRRGVRRLESVDWGVMMERARLWPEEVPGDSSLVLRI